MPSPNSLQYDCILLFIFITLQQSKTQHMIFTYLQAEEKYKFAVQGYEELREELLRDLPALNDDRTTVLGYVQSCVRL